MNDSFQDREFLSPEDLHRRLSEAVAPVQPTPDSLERLRHRVSARRRQRQALTMGGAVAAVVAGVALTAVLTGPLRPDHTEQTTASAGSSPSGTKAGDSSSKQATGTKNWPGPTSSIERSGPPAPGTRPSSRHPASRSATASPSPSSSATATPGPVSVPTCTAAALKRTDSQVVNKADGGLGYGWVEVANSSSSACTVSGPPVASVVDAATGADAGFTVAGRSAADSPGLAAVTPGQTLLLEPKDAYRFQFAWTNKAAADSGVACAGPESADTTKTWALQYQLSASGPVVAQVSLPAACKGTLYVTDVYRPGQYSEAFGA